MPNDAVTPPQGSPETEPLRPADDEDVALAIAFALNHRGRKRVHDANSTTALIAAQRVVEHLREARFVVMQRPSVVGGAGIARGAAGDQGA